MLKNSTKLHIHHVGGRFGNGGFADLPGFERDSVKVFYDADRDCIEQIRERYQQSLSEVQVLPYCLGRSESSGTLHVNYDPTSSSLYEHNPDYAPFYFFCYNHDFVVAETMRPMEKRPVDLVTLDRLCGKGGKIGEDEGPAPPDFLSLDAQGAEYDILLGAGDALESSCVAVMLEAWFHPVYQGQKLFGDICRLLSERGFYFVKFLRTTEYTPSRAPVGLRGDGFQVFSDALFLRRIDSVEAAASDNFAAHVMLRKLAFIAFVHDQFEYGLACLRRAGKADASHLEELRQWEYYRFLDDLEASVEKMPSRFPPAFQEKYSFELSRQRFANLKSLEGQGRRSLKTYVWLKLVYPRIYDIARLYEFLLDKVWAHAAAWLCKSSPVERVLAKYGLKSQARLLKRKRVVQSLFTSGKRKQSPSGPDKAEPDD